MGLKTRLEERYGCVVLSQFAAQALVRTRMHSSNTPVVVMEGVRPLESVFARNSKAAALGLRERMTRVEVETFGHVVILARCVAEEGAAKAILREVAGRFTPRTEERETGADWECVLDLSGTERLLGEPAIALRKLQQAVAVAGFEAAVVLCGNADAGLSLARAGRSAVIEQGEEARALAGLRVAVLGLDEEQEERFAAWGIRTLGDLAALPEVELIARMGQAGRALQMRALGRSPHHLEPVEEPLRLEETLEFDEAVETLEPLLFCMNVMLERLVARALERALALASVTVSLWMERCADRVLHDDEGTVPDSKIQDGRVESQSEPLLVAPAASPRLERTASPAGSFEARLGLASADAAVRKAWHRAALTGERLAIHDEPPVRGEALRERLGIGDGQAMRRKAAALHLVRQDTSPPLIVAESPALPEQAPETHARTLSAVKKTDSAQWGQAFERTIRPAVPVVDRSLLLKMLQLDLEAHPAPGAVIRMQLSAESGRAGKVQLGLFAPPMPEPTRFEDTHARLVSLVGERNVGRARPLDTHAQERFELQRFCLPTAAGRPAPESGRIGSPAMALRRMRPPLAVHVHLQEKRIERIWFEGIQFEVQRCYGPWRSSGQWWGEGVWSLDVWDVAGASREGDLLVLLIGWDNLRERWSVNGIYD